MKSDFHPNRASLPYPSCLGAAGRNDDSWIEKLAGMLGYQRGIGRLPVL